MEKFQAMILVFLEKGRPVRPCELVDALVYNPAFDECKDARRMVFYVLERLVKIGVVEKTSYRGKKSYYRLTDHSAVRVGKSARESISKLKDPLIQEMLACWRRVFELRSITKLWRIKSLGHALVYELHTIRTKMAQLDGISDEGRRALEDMITKLIELYSDYAATGDVAGDEPEVFHELERGIKTLSQKSWTVGGGV